MGKFRLGGGERESVAGRAPIQIVLPRAPRVLPRVLPVTPRVGVPWGTYITTSVES